MAALTALDLAPGGELTSTSTRRRRARRARRALRHRPGRQLRADAQHRCRRQGVSLRRRPLNWALPARTATKRRGAMPPPLRACRRPTERRWPASARKKRSAGRDEAAVARRGADARCSRPWACRECRRASWLAASGPAVLSPWNLRTASRERRSARPAGQPRLADETPISTPAGRSAPPDCARAGARRAGARGTRSKRGDDPTLRRPRTGWRRRADRRTRERQRRPRRAPSPQPEPAAPPAGGGGASPHPGIPERRRPAQPAPAARRGPASRARPRRPAAMAHGVRGRLT